MGLDKNNHDLLGLNPGEQTGDSFMAPREILSMHQKTSLSAFKIWACLITDVNIKDCGEADQMISLNKIWQTLDTRISFNRLETFIIELQSTIIKCSEYLPQVQQFKKKSFQLLGPSEITVDKRNNVVSLKYRFVKELLDILKDTKTKERFLIELKIFTSLKGRGGEQAKNLILLCTPYVSVGQTNFIEINELKKFMNLEKYYLDENGETIFKSFNRDALIAAKKLINENPYVGFEIDAILHKRQGRKVTHVQFVISSKHALKQTSHTLTNSDNSPLDPDELNSMLINFWLDVTKGEAPRYPNAVLSNVLRNFRMVESYISEIITDLTIKYGAGDQLTYQIFSIATAINQLWVDGALDKSNSKIYNYAYKIYTNPSTEKIKALCDKFLISHEIMTKENKNNKAEREKIIASKQKKAKIVLKALKKYDKEFKANALASISDVQIKAFENEFKSLAKGKRFGAWPKKAIESLQEAELTMPLSSTLTSRTLELYLTWISDKCVEEKLINAKSVVEFLDLNESMKRHIAYLECSSTMSMSELEASLHSLLD
ncbi:MULTISPECIES: replication initiation protein [Pseudoalteromonas]|uniref:replication initiation protein n=1 Tax=Pseudoalteromonas TaxID=53246 RepID=UPI001582F1BE|nr:MULTISPECIES: replication initiation protein [Pseudoalteromonas]MDI4654218.1 replication initiation protein [Pseudoalteromonas shioyasakiensis]NUJ40172.1 replication initiation protein [Pseudoalteromonas sp. 0303]